MGRSGERLKYPPIAEVNSRNRPDILEEIAGRKIPLHQIRIKERNHIIWHTTPAALEDEAKRLRSISNRSQLLSVNSTGYSLYLRRGDRDIYTRGRQPLIMSVQPPVLSGVAKRLAVAPWEEPRPGRIFGSDRRIVDRRFGYNIVTFSWTPPVDRDGIQQISPMEWSVFSEIRLEKFHAAMEQVDRKVRIADPAVMMRMMDY